MIRSLLHYKDLLISFAWATILLDFRMDTDIKFGGCSSINRKFARLKPLLKFISIIFIPLVLSPIVIFSNSKEADTGYVLLVVSVFWCTELLPLAITGLLPALLLPLFGIVSSNDVSKNYMKESVGMTTMAAFAVCVAIEKWNLHRRIALNVLLRVGFSPVRLLLGFMITCGFLSMWIANTATTTIMVPVVEAVLQTLRQHIVTEDLEMGVMSQDEKNGNTEVKSEKKTPVDKDDKRGNYTSLKKTRSDGMMSERQFRSICKMMCLCVAYGSTIGGSATIIGTGGILAAKAQVDLIFEEHGLDAGFTFFKWTAFAFPACIICLFLSWIWLQLKWLGFRNTWKAWFGKSTEVEKETITEIGILLQNELEKLGPISFAETATAINFSIMISLWFLKSPGLFPGWASLFPSGSVGTSIPPLLMCVWFFICPCKPLYDKNKGWQYEPIMDMDTMVKKIPWHLLLLFGGGMALADACQKSGLSQMLGNQMSGLQGMPHWFLITALCFALSMFTEFTSNVAVISIAMPVMAQLAIVLKLNPMQLMIPATMACTYAFMLPVATPPNAIVFSYGHLRVMDMVKTGFVLNVIAVILTSIMSNSWGYFIFKYQDIPTVMMASYNNSYLSNTNMTADVLLTNSTLI